MSTAMFIITSNNKTPQSLRSYSCLHLLWRWSNWWQLTQGGSEVRHQCSLCWNATVNQQSWEGPPSVWHHTERRLDLRKRKTFNEITKKNYFYHYRVVVYTHCQQTFQFKQLVKVHEALYDPFNKIKGMAWFWQYILQFSRVQTFQCTGQCTY